ncbi:CAP domain-containing protein [Virgibacillus doumboii]|uniref:CAP domain-containing protein n=1 Tax=Virgibacillus doumboii TaxID=2697503 RepID=UPI0013DF7C78|nr:CAP domain-containing protein [Virgibacillus doumboii]
MRLTRILVLLCLVIIGGYFFLEKNNFTPGHAIDDFSRVFEEKKNTLETKQVPEKRTTVPLDGDLFQWVNKTADDVTEAFGEPVRKDKSAYGYDWLVYKNKNERYIQFGIIDNTVQSIYAIGKNLSLEPVKIGQNYEAVKNEFSFKNEVTYNQGFSSYTFRLRDEELQTRPLVKLTDDIFMQLYFDNVTKKLSSIRVVSADILLQHRPYEMEYRGDLPKQPNLSDKQWAKVENGMEQQIFDITNVMRTYYGKDPLDWDKTVSEVAYLHSKDMAENNYFSHYGLNGKGLKERLAAKEVFYRAAGENIAAQYPDAPSAMHGWLNSEGHRKALLKDDYTHLGVGVYHFYYTQNFLIKQ